MFPYQGIAIGGGYWLHKSNDSDYRYLAPELGIFVGGWPVVGKMPKKDFVMLFEGGYNFGRKVKKEGFASGFPYQISFTDLFLGLNALKELELTSQLRFLYGGGISWHTLREYLWYDSVDQFDVIETRAGFNLNFVVTYYISDNVGLFEWIRLTKVFMWNDFDPSRIQIYFGIFQDLRGIYFR